MAPPADDHDCGWKAYAQSLEERLAALEKKAFGKKSEKRKASKLPPPVSPIPVSQDEQKRRREALAELREAHLETEETKVAVEDCTCDKCGSKELREIGDGKPSTTYEYVSPHFRKRVHLRQTLSCSCGHIITAKAPARMGEKTRYAPSFIAHLCTSKCADSIPQYRLAKEYARIGVPIARSTMNALFHRAADELKPLWTAACALVAGTRVVQADETTIKQANREPKGFVWTFNTKQLTVYTYAETRGGKVASEMLGNSEGVLVVDQYTGYNHVTKPGKRKRAGCMAHARRKIYETREHEGFEEALEAIGGLYELERDVKKAGIVGQAKHLALRTERSRPLFAKLLLWGRKQKGRFSREAQSRCHRLGRPHAFMAANQQTQCMTSPSAATIASLPKGSWFTTSLQPVNRRTTPRQRSNRPSRRPRVPKPKPKPSGASMVWICWSTTPASSCPSILRDILARTSQASSPPTCLASLARHRRPCRC